MSQIRFLKKQNVRSVWQKEDSDFTPWMASIEPLTHLLQECGIEVEEMDESTSIQTEVLIPGVGRRLDILVSLGDGTKIAIENQFSALDHDHLTRSLAYAVGLEVSTVIIVAEMHKSEFVNVAAYLNAAAATYDHGIKFFLVQLDVLSADGSGDVFPNFKLIEGPDEWRGAIEEAQDGNPKAEVSALIYNFHEAVLPFVREATGLFQNVNPNKNIWKATGLGIGALRLVYNVSKDYTTVQIWMHKPNSPKYCKKIFDTFYSHKDDIEKSLSPYSLDWRLSGAGIIEVKIEDFGYKTEYSEAKLSELCDLSIRFSNVVKKYLAEVRSSLSEHVED